jgi:hypothetical protein
LTAALRRAILASWQNQGGDLGRAGALSTGVHLLQEGGGDKFDVTLLCMEHRLGGKAASWRLPDGRYMEIGFHAVFGYYRALQTLVGRGGHSIDDARFFTPNEGVHLMYERGARAVNRLDIPSGPLDIGALFDSGFTNYQGMSFMEKLSAGRWLAKVGAELLLSEVPPAIDEHAFTAWCVGKGLDVEITTKSWFRYVLDLAFNYPNEGSAYVGMYGFQRLMSPESNTVYYLNGPLSEIIVAPSRASLASSAARSSFAPRSRIELDPAAERVQSLEIRPTATATPIPNVDDRADWQAIGGNYSLDDNPYPIGDPAPAAGGAARVLTLGVDFDEVVCTLPVDATRSLLCTTPDFERAVL